MTRRIVVATAVVAAITVAVGILLAIVLSRRVSTAAEQELLRQASVTADLLEQDLEDVAASPGTAAARIERYRDVLRGNLDRARQIGGHDVVEAVLVTPRGIVPITRPLRVIRSLPDSLVSGSVTTVDVDGSPMLVAVEPVEVRAGRLMVAVGRYKPLFPFGGVAIPILGALGVAAALAIGLGVWFSRSLSSRLGTISDTARRFGAGETDARAPVSGGDEIDDLAEAFNVMADEVAEARQRERRFLMDVSHDLRTPLTSISGYAEALEAGHIEPEDVPRVAGIVRAQSGVLARLVEDVMLLARIEAREFGLRPEPVQIDALVDDVAAAYVDRAAAAGIAVDVDTGPPLVREVDADRLTQILGNLLDNALRHTPEGGSIAVTAGVQRDGRSEISVTNSGSVIHDSDLPHVFERQYVADHYRSIRPVGSGLGLSIVAGLVDAMGGEVACTSDATSGTSFTVVL